MEDEEDFITRLSGSGESGSESPTLGGRIMLKIAAPPLDRVVTLALPIQQPRQIVDVVGGGGGDEGNNADGAGGNDGIGADGGNDSDGGGGSGRVVAGVSGGSVCGGAAGGIGSIFSSGANDGGVRIVGGGAGGGTGRGGGGGGGGLGGREDCWSEGATEVLIEAWGERFVELKRGNLKQNHWKEVADIVSSRADYTKTPKTDNQCKNRIDTVKKKYKMEKQRIALSGGRSSWRFFDRIEQLIGPNAKTTPTASVFATGYDGTNVPMGIPVGVRPIQTLPQFRQPERFQPPPQQPMFMQQTSNVKGRSKRDHDDVGTDEFTPERYGRKHHKMEREFSNKGVNGNGKSSWGSTVMELSTAILKLGEAYQHIESMKLKQLLEMEKHRMNFTKELELQRMQFMTRTQMEISRMKRKLKQQQSHRKQ